MLVSLVNLTQKRNEFRAFLSSKRSQAEGGHLLEPPRDPRLVQVIGRHFHFNAVTGGKANPAFAHLAAYGRQHQMLIVQLNAEHGPGQNCRDATFDFNMVFFT